MTVAAPRADARSVVLDGRRLTVRFAAPHDVLSFAIVGGGRRVASSVVWREVTDAELRPPVSPRALLVAELAALGLPGAVGLLTSRRLDRFEVAERAFGEVTCRAIATVGLGNALRVGDAPGPSGRVGTINILCQLGGPVTEEALVEALSLVVEARTAAVIDAGLSSARTGAVATGTGTDCVVVAAPRAGLAGAGDLAAAYAGKHTALGHVVGAAVYDAVARGAAAWKEDRASWVPAG